ncbi:hypothetical protein RV040_000793 [Vibrio alginolyticus]|uniref:hypothetical protein n=1 Tax=Vibrio alginolyticus TaxID=663 RepID=UPI00215D520D|nr:hypothetical protein [Vibrio alginolyticus]ELK8497326.1 hypothetical protein [Vibrio alginolyticus]MCR9962025.1 hypothetical protein [Vibrio alginolyticus]
MDVNVKEDSVQKYYKLGLGAILITALVYFLFFGVIERYSLSNDTSAWGTFGSYFGGVLGPVLSFLAFVILAKTLESQQKEAKRQREFSQIELKTLALENTSAEFESWLDRPKKLNGETLREVLDGKRASVKEAETVLIHLVFIAFYIKDLNDALTDYYGDETGFLTLSFKQRWALKYTGLTTSAKAIVEHDYLSSDQWKTLRDGGLLK